MPSHSFLSSASCILNWCSCLISVGHKIKRDSAFLPPAFFAGACIALIVRCPVWLGSVEQRSDIFPLYVPCGLGPAVLTFLPSTAIPVCLRTMLQIQGPLCQWCLRPTAASCSLNSMPSGFDLSCRALCPWLPPDIPLSQKLAASSSGCFHGVPLPGVVVTSQRRNLLCGESAPPRPLSSFHDTPVLFRGPRRHLLTELFRG